MDAKIKKYKTTVIDIKITVISVSVFCLFPRKEKVIREKSHFMLSL